MSDTHVGFLNDEIRRIQGELDSAKRTLYTIRTRIGCPDSENLVEWMAARENALKEVVQAAFAVLGSLRASCDHSQETTELDDALTWWKEGPGNRWKE